MVNAPDDYMLSGLYQGRNMKTLSQEEFVKEIKHITKEMGGTLEVFDCYDSSNNWQKIEIVYDKKEKD